MKNFPAVAMVAALGTPCLLGAGLAPFLTNECPGGLSDKCRTDAKSNTGNAGDTCELAVPSFTDDSSSITSDITCDRTGNTSLPQENNSDEQKERKKALLLSKTLYRWCFDGPPEGVPYLDGLPPTELPSYDWVLQVFNTLVNANISFSRNSTFDLGLTVDVADDIEMGNTTNIKSAISSYWASVMDGIVDNRATDISDYKNMHKFPLRKPESIVDYDDDEVFARYRLQGVNPITIKKCTEETRAKLKALDSYEPDDPEYEEYEALKEHVDSLMEEGKLFVVDHELLVGMDATPVDDYQRYLAVGIALFEYDGSNADYLPLAPIGIQLSQGDSDEIPPIFTPDDGNNGSYAWLIAKSCFEAADFIIHEVVSHLGYTHVLMEGVLVALHRELPKQHPIYTLIHPHLEGTALINWGAQNLLIVEGGEVDRLQANDIVDSWDLVLNEGTTDEVLSADDCQVVHPNGNIGLTTLKRLDSDFSPPADFERRNMTEDDFPGRYAYRDYGLKYWDAVLDWVTEYLDLYYTSDSDIEDDYELQAFVKAMIKKAQMLWFNRLEKSEDKKEFLAKIIASLIYTSSVLHAAVNFPQRTAVSYVPSSGVSMFEPIPTDKGFQSYEDYLLYLPPMTIAYEHVETLTLLGNVYYTKLGDYEASQFDDDRVRIPLTKFRLAIETIEAELVADNKEITKHYRSSKGPRQASNFGYKTLLPDNIPQSINI